MIKKIFVMPRRGVLFLTEKENTKGLAVISIYSSKKEIVFTKEIQKKMGCKNILNLMFADLSTEDYKIAPSLISKFPTFTIHKAQRTIRFLNKLKEDEEVKLLIIHCDAGISRSGAVGVFAIRYLNMDEKEFRKEHPNIGPNPLVYDILTNVSEMREDYQSWWENELPPDGKLIF